MHGPQTSAAISRAAICSGASGQSASFRRYDKPRVSISNWFSGRERGELGEPFEHVHEWLDALFKVMGPKHRSARHHAGGVEQVRKMWGDRAALAAEIHIKRDCGGIVPSEKDAQMVSLFGPKAVSRERSP